MAKLKKGKLLKRISILGAILLALIIFLIGILFVPFKGKVFPNIFVAGIYLGDKTESEALLILESKVKKQDKIVFYINGVKYEILTSEIDYNIDLNRSVARAYTYSSTGNFFTDIWNRANLVFKPVNLGLAISFNEDKLLESLLIISDKTGVKPVEPSIKLEDNQLIADPGKDGLEIDIEKLRKDIGTSLSLLRGTQIVADIKNVKSTLEPSELEMYKEFAGKFIGKQLELNFDTEKITFNDAKIISFLGAKERYKENLIKDEVSQIAKRLNSGPQNSVFVVENGVVKEFTPSKDGITVDEELLFAQIKESVYQLETVDKKTVVLQIPVIKQTAAIKNEDVNNLGIKQLLGRGVSTYRGSIANRVHNINLASSKFKGILVAPGETLSFNDKLGDVSALTGYKSAYVIKDGKTVLGDGGGVCQVSTTLFRALLSAGLPITERRAHSYRVGYYEQGFPPGLDATVYAPTTDLKFINDTPAHILIQPTVDNSTSTLVFEIYGTSDGRIAKTTKPIITSSVAPPEDLYVDDPTLPLGTIKQIEHKAWGAKVVFDYKVERDGELIIDKTFVSNFRPWQAVYLRGTGTGI